MDEKDKESGEMANLVPKAFVPLNTKHGRVKHIPKGPFHSKFKQVGVSNETLVLLCLLIRCSYGVTFRLQQCEWKVE